MHSIVTASVLALVRTLSLAAAVGADRHTCADSPSQAAAQAALRCQPQLDRDRDGIAGEGNRAPFARGATARSVEGPAPTPARAGGQDSTSAAAGLFLAGLVSIGAGVLVSRQRPVRAVWPDDVLTPAP